MFISFSEWLPFRLRLLPTINPAELKWAGFYDESSLYKYWIVLSTKSLNVRNAELLMDFVLMEQEVQVRIVFAFMGLVGMGSTQ